MGVLFPGLAQRRGRSWGGALWAEGCEGGLRGHRRGAETRRKRGETEEYLPPRRGGAEFEEEKVSRWVRWACSSRDWRSGGGGVGEARCGPKAVRAGFAVTGEARSHGGSAEKRKSIYRRDAEARSLKKKRYRGGFDGRALPGIGAAEGAELGRRVVGRRL